MLQHMLKFTTRDLERVLHYYLREIHDVEAADLKVTWTWNVTPGQPGAGSVPPEGPARPTCIVTYHEDLRLGDEDDDEDGSL